MDSKNFPHSFEIRVDQGQSAIDLKSHFQTKISKHEQAVATSLLSGAQALGQAKSSMGNSSPVVNSSSVVNTTNQLSTENQTLGGAQNTPPISSTRDTQTTVSPHSGHTLQLSEFPVPTITGDQLTESYSNARGHSITEPAIYPGERSASELNNGSSPVELTESTVLRQDNAHDSSSHQPRFSAFIKHRYNQKKNSDSQHGEIDHDLVDEIQTPINPDVLEELPNSDRRTTDQEEFVKSAYRGYAYSNGADPNPSEVNTKVSAPHFAANIAAKKQTSPILGAAKYKSLEKLIPAWSVEEFRWPAIARQLFSACQGRFDLIGNSIKKSLANHQKVLAVSGLYRRQGQTTLAICMANWAAANNLRCLLVDADLSQPGLALAAGLTPAVNWREVIRKQEFIEESLVRSIYGKLDIMPQGEIALPSDSHVDDWRLLEQVVSDFKSQYDLILLDMGPIREWIRTSIIRAIEGVISINHASIEDSELKESCEMLIQRGIPIVALAENRSKSRVA